MKKMAKQVVQMVKALNDRMKENHIKTEDEVFSTMVWVLIQAGCYHGFNYYTADGTLSGGINEKFDHIEIEIR